MELESSDYVAMLIGEELGEVPFHIATLGLREEFIQRCRIGALDRNLGIHPER